MPKTKCVVLFLSFIVLTIGVYHHVKPLPDGVRYEGDVHRVDASTLTFFEDKTYLNESGIRESEQEIFDAVFHMIDEAEEYILIDFFFYSDFTGVATSSYRELSAELTGALIAKKEHIPDITIQVITDPINTMYGGHMADDLEQLKESGIPVIVTELKPLRDSNPLYSSLWRVFIQWFGVGAKGGWLPNLLDEKSPEVTLRTYLRTMNYKANHRKVVVTDYKNTGERGFATLLTSANPHDGSSAHTNIALRMDSHIWKDALATEYAVAALSNHAFISPAQELAKETVLKDNGTVTIQLLTEGAIKDRALSEIDSLKAGDTLDMAMFYISDRSVVRALRLADTRGAKIRLLFDPNKDAFGREKNGVPNRQVANELMEHSKGNTEIRWCNTHGEQCHTKLLMFTRGDEITMLMGSANLTKRNIDDLNLETNVAVVGDNAVSALRDAQVFFDSQWSNTEGREYSVPYEMYADSSLWRTITYRVKEFTGISRW